MGNCCGDEGGGGTRSDSEELETGRGMGGGGGGDTENQPVDGAVGMGQDRGGYQDDDHESGSGLAHGGGGDDGGGGEGKDYETVEVYGSAGPRDLDGNNGRGGGAPAVSSGARQQTIKQSLIAWYETNAQFESHKYKVKPRYLSSSHPRSSADITIVTQCTTDRLDRLRAMAESWTGVISVAVYLKKCSVRKDKKRLKTLFDEIEARNSCRLDIALVFAPWREFDKMYPINNMRNVALDQAATDLVFLLDVDFRPSEGLHESLVKNSSDVKALLECAVTENIALVVPAFEVHDNSRFPNSKTEIPSLLSEGVVTGFHVSHFPAGHGATDYNRWHQAQKPYVVEYQKYFEPYVVCKRIGLRRYDERFRGYGMDKIIHIEGLFHDGFTFSVHPDGFVASGQHSPSKCWLRTYGPKKIPSRTEYVQALYNVAARDLNATDALGQNDEDEYIEQEGLTSSVLSTMPLESPNPFVMDSFDDATKNKDDRFLSYSYETEYEFRTSALPRSDSDITIVTQCSIDRFPRLERMARKWTGVISVAVYVQRQNSGVIIRQVEELFARIEMLGSCKMDISLLYENEQSDGMYPINNLRNVAAENAKTDLVFLLDVDFAPSDELFGQIMSYSQVAQHLLTRAKSENLAIVVPAFEVFDREYPDVPDIQSKSGLVDLLENGMADVFASRIYKTGHGATNSTKWLTTIDPYEITFENGYEPYVICRRDMLPRYDERFRGYGKNKIVQILAMAFEGYKFHVMPDVFVTSGQHSASASWEKTFGKHKIPGRWDRIESLYELAQNELAVKSALGRLGERQDVTEIMCF